MNEKNINRLLLEKLYILKLLGFKYISEEFGKIKEQKSKYVYGNMNNLKMRVNNCFLCDLAKTRNSIVFGEGDIKAEVIFVGEAPGANEDKTGKPFVGRAGQMLTKMIEGVLNLKRSDVYIANVIKCRPPNNRVPTPFESSCCKPYLLEQIAIIKPKIVVALGATAYKHLSSDDKTSISNIRGKILKIDNINLIATFHPSYLLRNPNAKKMAYKDLLTIKSML